jgi:hypothetical protein
MSEPSGAALQRRIDAIKRQIVALGPLRPGTLSQQYNVCGNPTCRCKADPPQKHGPYYQVSYTWRGQSRTHFVREEEFPHIQQQVANYERLRALVGQWIIRLWKLLAWSGSSAAIHRQKPRPNRADCRKGPRERAKSPAPPAPLALAPQGFAEFWNRN